MRSRLSLSIGLYLFFIFSVADTRAQTATYHLHREASSTANLFQLKTNAPDAAILAEQTTNLKNKAVGEYLIRAYDTQSGVPGASGTITAGSTVTFSLWLKRTGTGGTLFPRAKLNLNSAAGTSIAVVTGTTALTTTLTKYTLSGTVPANVSITASDRLYLWVGINLTAAPNTNSVGELDIEGALNGNYDSSVTVPLPSAPPPPPSISSLTPNSGAIGTSVNVAGTNFGATQGTSTINFNGTIATPASWSATSITVPVPSGATTGPVVVTVNGQASNGVTFTVTVATGTIAGTITQTSNGAAVSGALVEALQASVVKGSSTSAANGSYSIAGLAPGTYDVRTVATGYQTRIQNGVVVTANNTTTVNQSLDVLSITGDIEYVYDELGRLVAVVTPTERVSYSYDAVGNLLSISRGNSSQVSIIEFTPNGGSIGTTVMIYGTAFSTTPTQNTVTFNGVAATVTSATATKIVTSVPAGATTGPISVTSPAGTATSSASFVVGPSEAPTITGFSPNIGVVGTVVNITGTNFEVNSYTTKSRFNLTLSTITSNTGTNIVTSVPPRAASGHIRVATPAGSAVSSDDFFIPPSPYNAADVEVTGRMSLGEDKVVTITQPNKIAIIVFDGTAGERLTLGTSNVTMGTAGWWDVAALTIYKPDATVLLASGFPMSGTGTPTQVLPDTGTYAVVIDPAEANTGSVTLSLLGDLVLPINVNGPPVGVNFNRVGLNSRLTFSGVAGQRVSVGVSGVTIGTAGWWDVGSVAIYKPNGSVLLSPLGFTTEGAGTPSLVLPVTGTYSIVLDPYSANTGNAIVTVSEDFPGPISTTDPPVTLNFRPGQNTWLTFSGVAGQRVSAGVSAVGFGTAGWWDVGSVTIYKSDGTPLSSPLGFTTEGGGTPSLVLPVTGTYAILVDPYKANTGSAVVTLSEDFPGPISTTDPPVTLNFRPGQNTWLTFSGVAGQRVSAGVSAVGFGTAGWWDVGSVTIYKSDGTPLSSPLGFTTEGGGTASLVLPVTGTYAILVDPYKANTGSAVVTLSQDFPGPISTTDPPVTLNFRPGQNTWLTFSGVAGQRVSVGVSGVTFGTSGWWDVGSVAIYKPDGSALLSPLGFTTAGTGTLSQVLPVTGDYAILINPYISNTGNATITLSEDQAVPITTTGPPVILDFNRPGQNARLTFDGVAGQRVSVAVSGVTLGTAGWWDVGSVAIYKPDGTVLLSPVGFTTGGTSTVSQVLPVTGAYTIVADPSGTNTGSATVTLSEDLSAPISIGGPPVALSFNRVGQNAWMNFEGTAGQQVIVRVTGNTIGDVTVTLLKPDGTQLISTATNSSSFNLAAQVLPVTGTFILKVDPAGTNTGNLSVSLYDPVLSNANNLAYNKTATQSSTDWSAPASRAVDGNTSGNWNDGSVTHTAVQNQAWWEVDLGSVESIGNIDLWNRTDCCSSALTNFYVFVSDVPFTSTDLTTTINQAGVWSTNVPGQGGTPTTLTVNRTGRYVRVQLVSASERLSLAEVQVWRP